MPRPTIDVCIATYRRPALLRALIASVAAQETEGRFEVTICLADNDPGQSARPVAEDLSDRVPIRYAIQPEKSISITRNLSLSLGNGELVAIVDDDEDVPATWLLSHVRALAEFGAECSHGPVVAVFPEGAPGYLARSGLFGSIQNPESGATDGFIPSTNNCLFHRSVLSRLDHLFDESFGLTGGEDAELFQRLRLAGTRSIWCREAGITTVVPKERASLRWLVLRRYRTGITWARRMKMHEEDGYRRACRVRPRLLLRNAAILPAALAMAPWDPGRLWDLVRDLPFDVGVLASRYGAEYKEYA